MTFKYKLLTVIASFLLLSSLVFANTASVQLSGVIEATPVRIYLTSASGVALDKDAQLDFDFPNTTEAWERSQSINLTLLYSYSRQTTPVQMTFQVEPFTHKASGTVIPTSVSLESLDDKEAQVVSTSQGVPGFRLTFAKNMADNLRVGTITITARKEDSDQTLPSGIYEGRLVIDVTTN